MRTLFLLLGLAVVCPAAWAEGSGETDRGVFTLVVENDLFGGGTDEHYTHGTRAAWLSAEGDVPEGVKEWAAKVPLFAVDGVKRVSYSLGQNIFTPSDISRSDLIADDRPYAGWLYGAAGLVSDTGERLDNLELMLGVVGPMALAGEAQDFVHDLIGSPDPQGWDHQLNNEPGIVLSYERKWRSWLDLEEDITPFGLELDMTPRLGGSLGNVFTHAEAGVTFRLGDDLPSDYGPPRIRPSLPGSDFFRETDGLGWYLFAGVGGRWVLRNIFLDGNTFTSSHSVDKEPLVGDLQAGVALTWGPVRLAYTHIVRSKEYAGQGAIDRFGAISLSVRY